MKTKRSVKPRKSIRADHASLGREAPVEEPTRWCRVSRLPNHSLPSSSERLQSTYLYGDGVALEDLETTPDVSDTTSLTTVTCKVIIDKFLFHFRSFNQDSYHEILAFIG